MEFDSEACERYVRQLIDYDEVERALLVLDNVPALYRQNPPPNLFKLKSEILGALCTTHAYLSSGLDSDVTKDKAMQVSELLRGKLLVNEVARYNDKGIKPHIVDMGPGEYFIPISLDAKGFEFTYTPIAIDQNAKMATAGLCERYKSENLDKRPTIFVALEIIEHLPSTKDITIEAIRHCGGIPDRVHMSTPLFTYDDSPKDWNKPCGLPHLRAYTQHDFIEEARRLFPTHVWHYYSDKIQSLRGMKMGTVDEEKIL